MEQNKKSNWLLWVMLIFLPPFGILYMWIAKKELSQQKKKMLSIIFAIWFLFCIVVANMQKTTDSPVNESDRNIVTVSNSESASSGENNEQANIVSSHESTDNGDTADINITPNENFLLTYDLTIKDVMNGTCDTVIGKCAFIRITNDKFEKITPDMLKEFADNVVADSDYNWVSIINASDIGILFSGSDISSAIYGELDKDGSLLDTYGFWVRDDNGNYSYTETE